MELALPTFKAAIVLYRRVYQDQDQEVLANALHTYGCDLHAAGRDPEALPNLQAACEMEQRLSKGKDSLEMGLMFMNLSKALFALGRCDDALVAGRTALSIERRLSNNRDDPNVAVIENTLGIYLDGAGRSMQALPYYMAALEMRVRLYGAHDNPAIANSLNTVGFEFTKLGRLAQALPMLQMAVAMNQRIHKGYDNLDVANNMNNLAACLHPLGRRAEALRYLQAALQMHRRIFKNQDHPFIAMNLQNVAYCLQSLDRALEALGMYQEALAMSRRMYHDQDNPATAGGLLQAAECLSALNRHAEALPLFHDALEMDQRIWKGRDHPATAACMDQLAVELMRVSRGEEALAMGRGANAMAERLRSPDLFNYCNDLGVILLMTGHAAEAAKEFGESIDSLEQFRATMGGDDQDRMGFMSSTMQSRDPFGGMVRAQLELGHADTAAEYLDRGRAKSLLDILERGERLSDGDLLDPLEKKARLTNDKQQLKLILGDRTALAAAEDQVRQLTSRINHARAMNNAQGLQDIRELQPKLNTAWQEYANAHRQEFNLAGRTTFTEATTSLQIQSLVQPGQHLLMYSITPRSAVVLLIPPPGGTISGMYLTEADGKTRLSGESLQRLIQSYRRTVVQRGMNLIRGVRLAETEATTHPTQDTSDEGYQLFRQLLPDAVWREIQRDSLVYVVPDASMSGLPLEMLITQKPRTADARDNVYWLDHGPLLCYGPSAAALLELRRQETNREGRTYAHEAVLLGDPVLQRNDDARPRLPAPQSGALVTRVQAGSTGEGIGLRAAQ